VLVYNEFETLMKNIDPQIKKSSIVKLFREALEINDQCDDALE